jgi:hypothetical protein
MARHTSRPLAAAEEEKDEEEALLWAALRRLPTLEQRARHAIVAMEDGSRKVVADVGRVGPAERRALLGRLLPSGVHEDNEQFLLKLRDRIDRYVRSTICYSCMLQLGVLVGSMPIAGNSSAVFGPSIGLVCMCRVRMFAGSECYQTGDGHGSVSKIIGMVSTPHDPSL